MKMRNYLKKEYTEAGLDAFVDAVTTSEFISKLAGKRRFFFIAAVALVGVFALVGMYSFKVMNNLVITNEDAIQLTSAPISAIAEKKGVISIPAGTVKANPFVPYRNLDKVDTANDVPAYTLIDPPDVVSESSTAARVMDTIVSGILYDKFSPSAILNIEGNDYLVKKGDVVNNYKVLSIMQDSVTVQLGVNTYKAGIGEILTEGSLHHNEVSNLSNKFGGTR